MIDLHVHLLPGIDDGPSTWDEAIALVRMAAAEGVMAMVATSHMMPEGAYVNSREHLLELTAELRNRLQAAGVEVAIHAGAEVYMTADVPDRLERGELLTYCDAGRYMLLEMPATEIPPYAEQVIEDLCLLGVTPIIAHPERNSDIVRQPSRASALVEHGALLQVTASSLGAGSPVRAATRFLLRHGLVHFLASDAHRVGSRPPLMAKYLDVARGWVNEEMVRRLVHDNPAAVLASDPVDGGTVPARVSSARGLWRSVMRRLAMR